MVALSLLGFCLTADRSCDQLERIHSDSRRLLLKAGVGYRFTRHVKQSTIATPGSPARRALQHSFFLPIFLGLFTWLKATLGAWLKLVTPKLGVALLKNSFAIKLRDVVVKGLTEFAVFSHRPWRRRIMALKKSVTDSCLSVLRVYLGYPLWASSTWAVLALLIVPQPIIEWLKLRATVILRKLGVLKSLDTLSRRVVPAPAQARWDRYRRWTLGRRQIRVCTQMIVSCRELQYPRCLRGTGCSRAWRGRCSFCDGRNLCGRVGCLQDYP